MQSITAWYNDKLIMKNITRPLEPVFSLLNDLYATDGINEVADVVL